MWDRQPRQGVWGPPRPPEAEGFRSPVMHSLMYFNYEFAHFTPGLICKKRNKMHDNRKVCCKIYD